MSSRVDESIKCYSSGYLYTEDVLGYGISLNIQGRTVNLSTPAELLSKNAFDSGVRLSANKTSFSHFIPAFINPQHASENEAWRAALYTSIFEIGDRVFNIQNDLARSAYLIFPRLINTLVLEMMKQPPPAMDDHYTWDISKSFDDWNQFDAKNANSDNARAKCMKSPSIAFFEAICSCWRTYYWLNETVCENTLAPNAELIADKFTKFEYARHKNACPDVGAILASYTAVQRYVNFPQSKFIDALLDECFLRAVKWWKKAKISQKAVKVFEATQKSRDLALFQIYFLKFIIGDDPKKTAQLMDATNGKVPQILYNFCKQWKLAKEGLNNWNDFFVKTGCSEGLLQRVQEDPEQWVNECVRRALGRGRAYSWVIPQRKTRETHDGYDGKFDKYDDF